MTIPGLEDDTNDLNIMNTIGWWNYVEHLNLHTMAGMNALSVYEITDELHSLKLT